MTVINTNTAAINAQYNLSKVQSAMDDAMSALSSGKRINSAADDAAGIAISSRMEAQVRGLNQAMRNAADGQSLVDTAEGAMDEISNMLQRMRELAVQAGTGTTDSADRTYLNTEFSALRNEIDRIVDNTQWNGRNIMDGSAGAAATTSTVAFQIGQDGVKTQTLSTSFGNFNNTTGKLSGLASKVITGTTIASAINMASKSITEIDVVIGDVSSQRATFGAVTNRLTHAVDNLTNVKTNSEAARSRILDTDYASATSELARTQIIQQAGTAMLAQANALPQTVLALLQ